MKYTRHLVAIGLLALAAQARAGWLDSTVDEVINKVRDIWNTVTGDVKDTAEDLKRQLTLLRQEGTTLNDTVYDTAAFLQQRATAFQAFVSGGAQRCGQGSACWDFRMGLEKFVLDTANLRSRFPQIAQRGLGDGQFLVDIIDHLPPVALFGFYDIMQRVPNWQSVPQNISDLYDEIGDPDAFSLELPGASPATTAGAAGVTASSAAGQAAFGPPGTKTNIFCSKGNQPKWDTIRLNRLHAFFILLKGIFDDLSNFVTANINITVAGEGGPIPIPVKGFLKGVADGIDTILAYVDAHRANLAQCKNVERDVAACTPLVEYRTAAGNKKAYWVVKGVILAQGGVEPKADYWLNKAGNLHRNSRWRDAYEKICDAYAVINDSGHEHSQSEHSRPEE